MSETNYTFSPIGYYKSTQLKKYEAARQTTAYTEDAHSEEHDTIILERGHNYEQALTGLEGFSRIWVIFLFHQNQHWNPMTMPPRTPPNGPHKYGVFATRSPYRPNFIGMSSVKLLKIQGRTLFIEPSDILNNTPILDIKPYVEYADSFQGEKQGWLEKIQPYQIQFSKISIDQISFLEQNQIGHLKKFIITQLEHNPTDNLKKRVSLQGSKDFPDESIQTEVQAKHNYILSFKTWRILFSLDDLNFKIDIIKIYSGYSKDELMNSATDIYKDKILHKTFNETFRIMLFMIFLSGFYLSSMTGCSSWALKERCENTNWFEYAQKISNQGRYLEEDEFLKQCKEVERVNAVELDHGFKLGREKMCSYDEIYNRGVQGEPVFFKFCDGLEPKHMTKKHQEGLLLFCTEDVGYKYGASGKVYKNVCNATQEKAFIPSYTKGRREFLTESISSTTEQRNLKQTELAMAIQREMSISHEYSSIPNLLHCSNQQVYNPNTQKNEYRNVCEEPFYIKSQRESIYENLQSARSVVRNLQSDISNKDNQLQNFKEELNKLPNF